MIYTLFFSKCKEQLQSLCARICTEEITGDQSLPIYTQEHREPQPSIIMISGKIIMRNIENYLYTYIGNYTHDIIWKFHVNRQQHVAIRSPKWETRV